MLTEQAASQMDEEKIGLAMQDSWSHSGAMRLHCALSLSGHQEIYPVAYDQ